MAKEPSAATSGSTDEGVVEVKIIRESRPGIVDTQINKGHFFLRGKGRINAKGTDPTIRAGDQVVASITEVDGNNRPFLGAADVKVYGVAPFDGGVFVRADLAWGSDISCRIVVHW